MTTSHEKRVRQRSEKKRTTLGRGGALTIPGRASTCVDTRRLPSDTEMESDEQEYASDGGAPPLTEAARMPQQHRSSSKSVAMEESSSEEDDDEFDYPPGY